MQGEGGVINRLFGSAGEGVEKGGIVTSGRIERERVEPLASCASIMEYLEVSYNSWGCEGKKEKRVKKRSFSHQIGRGKKALNGLLPWGKGPLQSWNTASEGMMNKNEGMKRKKA